MAERNAGDGGVLVQVCIECGKEYMFDDAGPPEDLRCGRCGNTVFRSFFASPEDDEVQEDFNEATERDVATDDPATDVTRGDLQDLDKM